MYQAYSAEEKAALDKISAYLNSIRTLQSDFVRIRAERQCRPGRALYRKPGRIRFEFPQASPLLIVSTGGRLYVQNTRASTRWTITICPTRRWASAEREDRSGAQQVG